MARTRTRRRTKKNVKIKGGSYRNDFDNEFDNEKEVPYNLRNALRRQTSRLSHSISRVPDWLHKTAVNGTIAVRKCLGQKCGPVDLKEGEEILINVHKILQSSLNLNDEVSPNVGSQVESLQMNRAVLMGKREKTRTKYLTLSQNRNGNALMKSIQDDENAIRGINDEIESLRNKNAHERRSRQKVDTYLNNRENALFKIKSKYEALSETIMLALQTRSVQSTSIIENWKMLFYSKPVSNEGDDYYVICSKQLRDLDSMCEEITKLPTFIENSITQAKAKSNARASANARARARSKTAANQPQPIVLNRGPMNERRYRDERYELYNPYKNKNI